MGAEPADTKGSKSSSAGGGGGGGRSSNRSSKSTSAAAPALASLGGAAGESSQAAAPSGDKEKERVKEQRSSGAGEKSSSGPMLSSSGGSGSQRIGGYTSGRHSGGSSRASAGADGLADEVLTQIAQAKFDAQEDRLRDVARFSMALLRDFPKLAAQDLARKAAEIQRALLKYEMQVRGWEYQERHRSSEIRRLEEEAERCRLEAEAEGERTLELRHVLEKERRRRKRYEGYEDAAKGVNAKRTRADCESAITGTKEDIERLKQQRDEYEAMVEERVQRAQLIRSAVAELSQDLRRERAFAGDILATAGSLHSETGKAAAPSPSSPAAASPTNAASSAGACAPQRGGAGASPLDPPVEVIS